MDCNSYLGHKYILSGLWNSFMNYLLLIHTTFVHLLEGVFLVNVITGTDTVTISVWPSFYKKWHSPLTIRVAFLSIENSWSSLTKLLFSQQSYHLVGKVLWTGGLPHETQKNVKIYKFRILTLRYQEPQEKSQY